MPNPALTSVAVVNAALEQIASQSQISALSGTAPENIAASTLYTQVVNLLLRDMQPEFARRETSLSSGGTPVPPWPNSYGYPADCLAVRQVVPSTISANDPQPLRWSVVTNSGGGIFINTNQASASVYYITSAAGVGGEAIWDSMFTEAVVRTLASELAMAIAGRPDFSKQMLTDAGQLMAADVGRDS